jgi:hypothetical protein
MLDSEFKLSVKELLEKNLELNVITTVRCKLLNYEKSVDLEALEDKHALGILCNKAKRAITQPEVDRLLKFRTREPLHYGGVPTASIKQPQPHPEFESET